MNKDTLEKIKNELSELLKSEKKLDEPITHQGYVVVRTYSAGVHIGFLTRLDETTQTVELSKTRRIHKWSGALSLSEICNNGVAPESKLSEEIEKIILLEAIEILFATNEAKKILRELKAYKND